MRGRNECSARRLTCVRNAACDAVVETRRQRLRRISASWRALRAPRSSRARYGASSWTRHLALARAEALAGDQIVANVDGYYGKPKRARRPNDGYGPIGVDLLGNCRVRPLGRSHGWLSALDDPRFSSRYRGTDQPLRCPARNESGLNIIVASQGRVVTATFS